MSDYLKVRTVTTFSENSDYSDPEFVTNFVDYEITPDEAMIFKVEADTGGTTFELGSFADITYLEVVNLDTTNYVDVTVSTDANSSTTFSARCPKSGGRFVVCDPDPADDLVLTANTAACLVKVVIAGS